jgi:hypothetical protein
MRNRDAELELRPSLIGVLGAVIGATAVGAPVDTLGFKELLGVLTAGAIEGSAGAGVFVDVKLQEGASLTGTGALWTDIADGAINGTAAFTQISLGHGVDVGTWIPYGAGKLYEQLGLGRERYIRAHATLTGTVGLSPKVSCSFLLGRPSDTLYVGNAVSFSSGNPELTKLL